MQEMDNKYLLNSKIESGEYFEEARFWYAIRYIAPHYHLTYVLLACLIIFMAALVASDTATFQSAVDERPFPLYTEDATQYFSRIKRLTIASESLTIAVARYLLEQYVTSREQYISYDLTPEEWQNTLNRVRESSSRKVFDQYIKYIDPVLNSSSPVLKYKMQASRFIQVQSVEFQKNTDRPNYADVLFVATEKTSDTSDSSYWIARVNFSMSSINNVLDRKSDLDFIVTDYSSYETKRG